MKVKAIGVKFIIALFIFFNSLTVVFAASQLKVICDLNGERIYVDKEFKGTCDADEPVFIIVPPGKHKVEVKRLNKDGSYYYFVKTVEMGEGVRVTVEVDAEKVYTENYYYNKARKSGKPADYWKYLKKYPNGKYTSIVKNWLDEYYWNRCKSVSACKEYLNKIIWGKHRQEAKRKLEDCYFEENYNSIEGCETYLRKYPRGHYVAKVKTKLEKLYFEKCNSVSGCEEYLKKYPNGKYVKQVKSQAFKLCISRDLDTCLEEYYSGLLEDTILIRNILTRKIKRDALSYLPPRIYLPFRIEYVLIPSSRLMVRKMGIDYTLIGVVISYRRRLYYVIEAKNNGTSSRSLFGKEAIRNITLNIGNTPFLKANIKESAFPRQVFTLRPNHWTYLLISFRVRVESWENLLRKLLESEHSLIIEKSLDSLQFEKIKLKLVKEPAFPLLQW